MAKGYCWFLAHYPFVMVVLVVVLMTALTTYIGKWTQLPSFKDPIAGFEARGTAIKGRSAAADLLKDSGLTNDPYVEVSAFLRDLYARYLSMPSSGRRRRAAAGDVGSDGQVLGEAYAGVYDRYFRRHRRNTNDSTLSNSYGVPSPQIGEDKNCPLITNPNGYLQLVFESSQSEGNLFTASSLKAMCSLEDDLILSSGLVRSPQCRGPSVPYYVAKIVRKQCHDLTDEDVSYVLATLKECAVFYHSKELSQSCLYQPCDTVPTKCLDKANVYVILHYLVDYNFLNEDTNSEFLRYALLGVNIDPYSETAVKFYTDVLENGRLDNGVVGIIGIDSKFKYDLFEKYLLADMALFVLAIVLIIIILFLYLRSFVVTIATVLDVAFSFVLAYFIYKKVFLFPYFPFMNILAMLILIAIGADDVFIFYDTWQQTKELHPDKSPEFWIYKTMRHAAMSIFVTSLTTAAAFYANFVSEITAIKCFGVFSGTAILCNFVMMVTWIPGIILFFEWANNKCCFKSKCFKIYYLLLQHMKQVSDKLFGLILPSLISYLWFLWIIVFVGLGVCGLFIVFVNPGLKLPTSTEFQVFSSNHPIERYARTLQTEFRFIKQYKESENVYGQSITMLWGLKAVDNGDHLDPESTQTLVYDESFDLSLPESQTWMLNLCLRVKQAPYVTHFYRTIECTIDAFNKFMNQSCYHETLEPCCGFDKPPFEPHIFKKCYPFFIELMTYQVSISYGVSCVPFFDLDNDVKVLKIYFETTQPWSSSYEVTDTFYKTIESLMDIAEAPPGVKGGWFTGEFRFYDLQKALSRGTYIAIALSLGVAFIVMLVTSRNVLIAIYAIINIALTISLTVGVLVLLGWELNILESVIISLAVGLSIDFSIHYGVAFTLSDHRDKASRVKESFERVGSAVAMAAITTFLAGAAIMSTKVLAYQQLGIFLMLVMATSWTYATFFFQSVCRIIGPNGNFAQIPLKSCRCCKAPEENCNESEATKQTELHRNALAIITSPHRDIYDGYEKPVLNGHHIVTPTSMTSPYDMYDSSDVISDLPVPNPKSSAIEDFVGTDSKPFANKYY